MADSLEVQFHEEMVNIHRNALTPLQGDKFLEMVTMQGGLNAARTLLHTPYLPDGFAEL
jgi:hypothetical protein